MMNNKRYIFPIGLSLLLLIFIGVYYFSEVDSPDHYPVLTSAEEETTVEATEGPVADTTATTETDTIGLPDKEITFGPPPPIKKSKHSIVKGLLEGNLAHYVPDSMEVNKPSRVTLTVSKNMSLTDLKESLEASIAHEPHADTSQIVLESILIAKVMTADLYAMDSSALRISRKSRYQQYVHLNDNDTTQTKWEWSVTPLKEGNQNILIKVSAKIFDGTIEEWIDFEVYNGVVRVTAVPDPDPPTTFETIISYWKENWEWIVPTLGVLGTFITWLLSTFGKKNQGEKKDQQQRQVG